MYSRVITEDYLKNKINGPLKNKEKLIALRKAFNTTRDRQNENKVSFPDLSERKERLKKTRDFSIGNKELLAQAINNFEKNGFRVYYANTKIDALNFILKEIGDEKLIVKSKSNVTKEIGLHEHLEKNGIKVIETDLGDYIIQLSTEKPAHPTGPACHLSRHDIAKIFSDAFGEELEPDPLVLTKIGREKIRDYIEKSKIGITGANAICAEEGAAIIINNEGNINLVQMREKKHIIVTSIDKLYPNIEEAINMLKLCTYYATGASITSYIEIIAGISKTADIEKMLFKGMQGPSEVVLVLLDNGRTEAFEKGYKDLFYCIGCGNCLLDCPVYYVLGNEYGYKGYLGGRGTSASFFLEGPDNALENGLFFCTTCNNCEISCPVGIGNAEYSEKLRENASSKGMIFPTHEHILQNIKKYKNPFGGPSTKQLKEGNEVVYFRGCMGLYREKEIADSTMKILEKANVSYALIDEVCCGSVALRTGNEKIARELAKENLDKIKQTGAKTVIFSCAGCLRTFMKDYPKYQNVNLELLHSSQYFLEIIKLGRLKLKDGKKQKITFHDPCHMGRHLKIYEEPREIIRRIPNIEFVEMKRSKEDSRCCGAGGGVKSLFGDLSISMANERINDANEIEAELIVSTCPFCKRNLKDTSKMEIIDLSELILEYSI
ncbi:MAG: hydrogenase MvhADGHdrABC CoB-CoM heterodisulfide reductase subunit B [Candidatus Methanofastidiosum methylothiophilum]|uniref:Hydrogenase MvhADGHdrABC CoB-CoM heterodisulfide reductase subunit B n=1 Tax=Candidatus Methanofastidiosum methylothiophilum TaxID=1705564 RepID=A0A150IIT5_9EURY|nr:MAG: hydrogenase MvhADGHdrABC CoB-CoM heterodisulfide reductase subunit B [Candidatus Methanofastidiosum methylthiophilus]KYC47812.1 MAG: hydrogenase MvhADGHdrABC CoB-CoM heterodisulfide reductase subunit B [Candidatus Methanofastidiosum methylthiophilus]KYC49820.1 MAG: hydrogenase MvhADGHdrABC CoB-CoM heterodisulfide reductase subunit B [Candidatus Methanofastidiosum methylthiophilus]